MCGECAGCLWARERYAMSALRCFITSKAKLRKKEYNSNEAQEKIENTQRKGGMGGRHSATTQGF